MKNMIVSSLIIGILVQLSPVPVYAQQEVWVGIKEGMPMIPVALPAFRFSAKSEQDRETIKEMYETLWNDLNFAPHAREHPLTVWARSLDGFHPTGVASRNKGIIIVDRRNPIEKVHIGQRDSSDTFPILVRSKGFSNKILDEFDICVILY